MERITTSNPTFKIRSQKVQPFIGQIALQVDVPTKSCVIHYLSRIPKKDHTNRYLPFFCVKGVSEPKILSRYGICNITTQLLCCVFRWLWWGWTKINCFQPLETSLQRLQVWNKQIAWVLPPKISHASLLVNKSIQNFDDAKPTCSLHDFWWFL